MASGYKTSDKKDLDERYVQIGHYNNGMANKSDIQHSHTMGQLLDSRIGEKIMEQKDGDLIVTGKGDHAIRTNVIKRDEFGRLVAFGWHAHYQNCHCDCNCDCSDN